MKTVNFLLICVIAAMQIFLSPSAYSADSPLRFGSLPVLQALPLYVAQERDLFRKAGLNVEIVPFNGASEKDIALASGIIDGYFGDLITPTLLKGNGKDVYILAVNYETKQDRRMFAILAKPNSKYKKVSDLAGTPIAVASNSIVHFLTDKLLSDEGVPKKGIETVETKNIGMRMQMLLSGQVEAAVLPEPLVTAAISKGAVLLADDSNQDVGQTVLVFSGKFTKSQPEVIKRFFSVLNEASQIINNDPESIRSIMTEHVRLPEDMKATYPIPKFPLLHRPKSTK